MVRVACVFAFLFLTVPAMAGERLEKIGEGQTVKMTVGATQITASRPSSGHASELIITAQSGDDAPTRSRIRLRESQRFTLVVEDPGRSGPGPQFAFQRSGQWITLRGGPVLPPPRIATGS